MTTDPQPEHLIYSRINPFLQQHGNAEALCTDLQTISRPKTSNLSHVEKDKRTAVDTVCAIKTINSKLTIATLRQELSDR